LPAQGDNRPHVVLTTMNALTKAAALLILAAGTFTAPYTIAKHKNKMKLQPTQAAPAISTGDVYGRPFDLGSLRGKKVLLSFHRFAGCPVCNLRFHQLEAQAPYFKDKGLVLVGIYESSRETMQQYLEGQNPYTIMIPNPDESLYRLYGVERSKSKVLKGLLKGAMGKALQGNKLYKNKIKHDGHADRIGADFIIDEQGNIQQAHYGQYLGDNLPLEDIKGALGK